MANTITVPRLGWSMDEGTFVRWLKAPGEYVRAGELLFELEGEKAIQEIEALDSGVLYLPPDAPPPGTVLPVGATLGYLLAEGEAAPAAASPAAPAATPVQTASGAVPGTGAVPEAPGTGAAPALTAPATPRARHAAAELHMDWRNLRGTGRGGRIRERDVRAAAEARAIAGPRAASRTSAEAGGGAEIETGAVAGKPFVAPALRSVIARRMMVSRQRTAPVTLTRRIDATHLVSLRQQFKSRSTSPVVPSYTDIAAKVVALALSQHPQLNARWEGEQIVLPDGIHLGIAVDTDQGLMVPVLHNVQNLTLREVASRSRALIERVRAGTARLPELQGGTFTITNLGSYGVEAFTPIIHYPETAILGLGAIRLEPAALADERIVVRPQMTLSLTFDHQVVDGGPAARFLQEVGRGLEAPAAWLIDGG